MAPLKKNPYTTSMQLGEAALGACLAGWEHEPRLALGVALASQPRELAPEMLLAALAAEIQLRCERLALNDPRREALVDLSLSVESYAHELDMCHAASISLSNRMEEA